MSNCQSWQNRKGKVMTFQKESQQWIQIGALSLLALLLADIGTQSQISRNLIHLATLATKLMFGVVLFFYADCLLKRSFRFEGKAVYAAVQAYAPFQIFDGFLVAVSPTPNLFTPISSTIALSVGAIIIWRGWTGQYFYR